MERVPAIREIRLEEGAECLLAGDVEAGKAILRDHVDAAVGFQEVAGQTNKSSKSLMRMPRPHGNPQVRNLFQIIGCLQKRESVQLKVQTVRFGLRANHSVPRPFERPTIAQDRGHTPPPLQIARSV